MIEKADVPGTVYFDFSSDGIILQLSNQMTNGTDGDFEDNYSSVCSKYFRVRIVNGGSCAGGSSESVLDLGSLRVKIQAGDIFVITAHTISSPSAATFTTTWQEN